MEQKNILNSESWVMFHLHLQNLIWSPTFKKARFTRSIFRSHLFGSDFRLRNQLEIPQNSNFLSRIFNIFNRTSQLNCIITQTIPKWAFIKWYSAISPERWSLSWPLVPRRAAMPPSRTHSGKRPNKSRTSVGNAMGASMGVPSHKHTKSCWKWPLK